MASKEQITTPIDYGKGTDYTPYPPGLTEPAEAPAPAPTLEALAEHVAGLTLLVLQLEEIVASLQRGC